MVRGKPSKRWCGSGVRPRRYLKVVRAQHRLWLHARGEYSLRGGHLDGISPPHRARGRIRRTRIARHHVTRQLHGAARGSSRMRFDKQALPKLTRTDSAARRERPNQFRQPRCACTDRRRNCAAACSSRRCCSAWEKRFVCCCRGKLKDESWRIATRRLSENEKGPGNRGLGVITCLQPFVRATPRLLLFLRSSLFLRGGFLGCALHRFILPNIKFCDSKKSQCDSYIRCFGNKVKKKMREPLLSISFELRRRIHATKKSTRALNLDCVRAPYIQLDAHE